MARSKRQRARRQKGQRPAEARAKGAPRATRGEEGQAVRAMDEERRLWWLREALMTEPTLGREALIGKVLARVQAGELSEAAALPEEPTERARELAFRAMEAEDDEAANRLAREALGADPLCTDAHLVLLRCADLPLEEQLEPLETITGATRDLLGAEALAQPGSASWTDCRMRPFLRALGTLAAVAGRVGDSARALAAYGELTRLDPSNRFRQRQRHVLQQLVAEDFEGALGAEAEDAASLWTRALAVARVSDPQLEQAPTLALFQAAEAALPGVVELVEGASAFPDELELDPESGGSAEAALTADVLLEALEHSDGLSGLWSAWRERAANHSSA